MTHVSRNPSSRTKGPRTEYRVPRWKKYRLLLAIVPTLEEPWRRRMVRSSDADSSRHTSWRGRYLRAHTATRKDRRVREYAASGDAPVEASQLVALRRHGGEPFDGVVEVVSERTTERAVRGPVRTLGEEHVVDLAVRVAVVARRLERLEVGESRRAPRAREDPPRVVAPALALPWHAGLPTCPAGVAKDASDGELEQPRRFLISHFFHPSFR